MNADDKKAVFPYYYGLEAEQLSFFQVPKILFQEQLFRRLSVEARMLYSVMLDRMRLSARNGWLDDKGRVFIYFSVEEVMWTLSCGRNKAIRLLAELDGKSGIGLVTRKRQGQGKPDMLFVHKCCRAEVSKEDFQKFQNQTSGSLESKLQEVPKTNPNNTERNKTEMSDTDSFLSSAGAGGEGNGMKEREEYRRYFWEQLGYEYLLPDYPFDRDILEEILELLVDTCCVSSDVIRIAGDDKPAGVVKSQLMKLTGEHIRLVLSGMKENTTKVWNIKQYLLTMLYNAPMTISSYYTARVNHDFYGGG